MSSTEQPTKHVYHAIAQVTAAMALEGIAKNRKNPQQGNQYRGIDDVYNALSTKLADAKLVILPRVTERTVTDRETKNGGVMFHIVLKIEYDFISAVDASMHTAVIYAEGSDTSDKGTGKALSYGYKSLCFQAFCIPVEGQEDGDEASPQFKPAPAQKPKGPFFPLTWKHEGWGGKDMNDAPMDVLNAFRFDCLERDTSTWKPEQVEKLEKTLRDVDAMIAQKGKG